MVTLIFTSQSSRSFYARHPQQASGLAHLANLCRGFSKPTSHTSTRDTLPNTLMEIVDEHLCEELNAANFKRIAYVTKHQIGNANGRCSGH